MKKYIYPDKKTWDELLERPPFDRVGSEKTVSETLLEVKKNGDAALRKYSLQFDAVVPGSFLISEEEMASAEKPISLSLAAAIRDAYSNILKFHTLQKTREDMLETVPGVVCWRRSVPVQKVGFYIPGGTAPLFSTVLMLGIPARLAGCNEVIICTPPGKNGKVDPAILFAANLCGIKKLFKVGGAQAIAAMAYGTESVPKVYKIFGPGNRYVTCAKQLVQMEGVAIDMPAGPSEVAILADGSANGAFVAADLLSQAEHGADSQAVLVTDSRQLALDVEKELAVQVRVLPRRDIVEKAIASCKIFIVRSIDEGLELINEYAPEHLILAVEDPRKLAEGVINAGSVFLGHYSPESAGDYASGTNHTLPTNGSARCFSGISVDSFVKKITFQSLSRDGLARLSGTIIEMAEAEGLRAHANAVKIRFANV